MAYRLLERRERESTGPPPSYLDDFLENIETLPNSIRTIFQEMRSLDDKIQTIVSESSATGTESVNRATTKGVALENVKRTMHEFVHFQASAMEYSEKKQKLATEARDSIVEKIEEMNKKLADFEKQLKKEGRWPKENGTGDEVVRTSRAAKAPAHLAVERTLKTIDKTVKGRRVVQPTTPRTAALAARAEEKIKKKEEEKVVDESLALYCKCRKVSHGDMVACEGKNCKYEWFHFGCVGLTSEPKGSWYCDSCTASASIRRKSGGGRKKS